MAKKPVRTIADIAQIAGVSKSTVSRALSDSSLISQETKDRIRRIAKEHNFQINQPARNLSLRQSRTIAYVTHGYYKDLCVEDLFQMEILGAISRALAAKQYDLLMVHVDPSATDWPNHYLNTGRVDGFILMTATTYKQDHIRSLIEMQAPFVAWGNPQAELHGVYCSVNGDNLNGGRLATQHLLDLGRRRIAFIGGPKGEREVQLRLQGYMECLQAAGIQPDPDLITYGHFCSAAGSQAMTRLLARTPDIDAVFANSDLMAIAAMNVLRERQINIPQQVAVVGYDDLSIAQYSIPPLTTVRQNTLEVGRILVDNLIQYIETGVVTNVSVPVTLSVRGSTAMN